MKISLNQLVSLTSSMVGQPFSVPLQSQLKTIFNYKRADWMQKIVDKHPEQRRFFYKDISIDLVDVDEAELPITIGCDIKRTSLPIPRPLRTQQGLFDSVGSPDKFNSFAYVEPQQLELIVKYGSKYTKDTPKYSYIDKYIYIYLDNTLEQINIRGIWPDQRELNPFKYKDKPCYTDDDQYDIPDDIINTMIQDVLKNEYKALVPTLPETTLINEQAK